MSFKKLVMYNCYSLGCDDEESFGRLVDLPLLLKLHEGIVDDVIGWRLHVGEAYRKVFADGLERRRVAV